MSNCIEIKNETVVFSKEEFDVDAFIEDKLTHLSHSLGHSRSPPVEDYFCWYLRDNSSIIKDADNEPIAISISFGKGLSSHTWRDFDGTIALIKKYMRKPKSHRFNISDEFDNFQSWGYHDVTFG